VPRSSRLLLPLAAVLAAAVGIGFGIGLHIALRSQPVTSEPALPAVHGQAVWPAGKRRAPAFTLLDQNGRLVSLRAQRGHSVVVAFMDPLCKQECPIESRGISLAVRQLAPAQRPTLLIVSVNPLARPADVTKAAHKWGITGDWHWLLGVPEELAPVWRAYGISVIPRLGNAHSTAVYLIDRNGFERAGFIAPFLPQFVADDLRLLATRPVVR
jgi:cytochrome oxidase Cu insertion factor (SCO1/SenC/PrrC family)